jgi:hypothetical protein
MGEVLKYGKWYHVKNHHTWGDNQNGTYLDVSGSGPASGQNYLDVSASLKKDRAGQGTGVWKIESATVAPGEQLKKEGDDVMVGDTFYLRNNYGDRGYLDVIGACRGCPAEQGRSDVSTSRVKHRDGAGSKTSIWKMNGADLGDASRSSGKMLEADKIHIQSTQYSSYLDVCGEAQGQGNPDQLDVSTCRSPNRDGLTGTWSFIPYDSADYDELLKAEPEVPPNTLKIQKIQCVVPSSGVFAANIFATAAGIIGGAVGAGISTALFGAMTAATGGAATPLAVLGVIGLTAEMSAIGAAVGVGGQKIISQWGQTLPDQAYIKVNGNKVWGWIDMKAGDSQDVNCPMSREWGKPAQIEIWEHDVILADDLLYHYQLMPNDAFLNCPIAAINDDAASSYIIYLTATDHRSSRKIAHDARLQLMNQS